MLRLSALVLTGALAIGVAACGSSGNNKAKTGGGATSSSSGAGPSATTAGGDGGGGGAASEIAGLVRKAKTANVKVTYKTAGTDNTFTLAQFNGDSSMATGDSSIVTSGAKTYSCTGKGTGAMCTELPGGSALGTAMLTGFFGAYSALFSTPDSITGRLGFVEKTTSTATIAGRGAKCATIKAGALGALGEVKMCVDAQTGILLEGTTTAGGQSSTLQATEFKESTAADVKLPAQPTQMTMPTIPNVTQPSY